MRTARRPSTFSTLVLACAALGATALTPAPAAAAPVAASDAFQRLKSLAGEWTGTVTERDTGPAVRVVYAITAGGSVVEERLFPGTPHEMVTMYHLDGEKLVLTHYCAMGNQPHMALAPESTAENLVFDFVSATNLAAPEAMHMHSGWLRPIDANTVDASWDVYDKGAKVGENRFFLKRIAKT